VEHTILLNVTPLNIILLKYIAILQSVTVQNATGTNIIFHNSKIYQCSV